MSNIRKQLLCLLAAVCCLLCGCKQNPTQEELYAKMFAYFEEQGFQCSLTPLGERDVPIYKASAWNSLHLGSEEVLVYFDESNRADYLSSRIDSERYSIVTRFGLRFVLVYEGHDARVLDALETIQNP